MKAARTALKAWAMGMYARDAMPAALVSALFLVFRLRDL
jgi:hypothetical protein